MSFLYLPDNAVWDPVEVLEILNPDKYDSPTCVGYAPSKGRRCQNPIAQANRICAERLLDEYSTKPPDASTIHDALYQVAQSLLCKRYHRSQVEGVVKGWVKSIERVQRRQRRRARSDESTVNEIDRAAGVLVGNTLNGGATRCVVVGNRNAMDALRSLVSATAGPRADHTAAARSTAEVNSGPIRSAFGTSAVPSSTPSNSHGFGSRSATSTNNTGFSSVPELDSAATADESESASSVTELPNITEVVNSSSDTDRQSSVAAASPPVSTPASEAITEPEQPHCSITHSVRRSTDGMCICCLQPTARTRLEDLVWCKAQCGQSIHKACHEVWAQQCQSWDPQGSDVPVQRPVQCTIW